MHWLAKVSEDALRITSKRANIKQIRHLISLRRSQKALTVSSLNLFIHMKNGNHAHKVHPVRLKVTGVVKYEHRALVQFKLASFSDDRKREILKKIALQMQLFGVWHTSNP